MSDPDAAIVELERLRDAIVEAGPAAGRLWGELQKALKAAGLETKRIPGIIMGRSIELLEDVIHELRGDAVPQPPPGQAPPPQDIPHEVKRKAMKAFRRRMKLMRLDHESKLGRSPLTGGKAAAFESILPPQGFPEAVWPALAHDGHLRPTGAGFYALPEAENDH